MKHIMAVYDVDPFYAARFAEVVNQKEKIPFDVVAFSSLEKLRRYAEENTIELLLISSAVNREETDRIRAARVIALSDGETVQADMEYPSVYKFQSSDCIIREVLACYCDKAEALPGTGAKKAAKILGVFSPVGRCLKTSFAITLSKILSQDRRVLYLNLEECSGLSTLTRTEYRSGLSDLLYFYSGGNYNMLRLNSVVHAMDGLDYVPPVRYPEDLVQAAGQLAGLIQTVAESSPYDVLVIDAGNFKKEILPVLALCEVIYMPVKEDSVSLAKQEEFDLYLEHSGNGALKEKIRKLKLPYHSCFGRKENYLEQLLWGELGDYTRQLLYGGFER